MDLLLHILDRFFIHFFASTSLVLLAATGVRVAAKKLPRFAPPYWMHQLVIAALLVFAFSTLREAVDVAHGQPLVKAFTDYASWLLGSGVSVWAIYRFVKDSVGVTK
jgi:hypothetical protein